MKIYISADIEGVTGVTHTHDATKPNDDYREFQEQMTAEVCAACSGALKAGAKELYIKDAHDTGRNLITTKLPEQAKLIRGWSKHPFGMMQDLDDTFDAVIMVGYHSAAASQTSPLAHTLTDKFSSIKINAKKASEFLINSYTAGLVGVPVAFISGDKGICDEALTFSERIWTVSVQQGIGASTVSIHPHVATKKIEEGVEAALSKDLSRLKIKLPPGFKVKIDFQNHISAYRASFYPGVTRIGSKTIQFEAKDYFEVLRTLMFIS
jgi:D-amino peptidase